MDLSIIGGQDGPTAVLTSGGPAGLILTLLLIAAAAGAAEGIVMVSTAGRLDGAMGSVPAGNTPCVAVTWSAATSCGTGDGDEV